MIPKDNKILILDKVSLVIPIIVRLDSEIPDSETLKITDRNRLDNTLISGPEIRLTDASEAVSVIQIYEMANMAEVTNYY